MRVVFFGTSRYCLPVLEALKKELVLVITREDKPLGRKQILTPSATKVWAEKHSIPVITNGWQRDGFLMSESQREHHLYSSVDEDIKGGRADRTRSEIDFAIVADFGEIIPPEIFNQPKLGTFNIHFSKLPDLRGASPVQSAILRGDTKTAITIFRIEKTLDTGPILWQKEYSIDPDETAEDLYKRLFVEAAKILPTLDFSAPLQPQTGKPTFCKKLTRDAGYVEWSKILNEKFKMQNYNVYRAMTPWPGLWTLVPSAVKGPHKNRRMKILKCHLEVNKLVLDLIQFEGEKPKTFSDKLAA